MEHQRRDQRVTDAALAREIEAALAVEPSPEFVARVRARVAGERPARWPLFGRAPLAWTAAATVAAAVVLAIVWPSGQRTAVRESAPPILEGRPVASAQPLAPSLVPRVVAREPRPAVRTARVAAPGGPPVIIAADEAAALRRFLQGVREGRVDTSGLVRLNDASVALPSVQPVVVAPLSDIRPVVVEPLPRVAALEGAIQ